MRIGVGGIVHETNTYCGDPTEFDDFTLLQDERLLRRSGTETDIGGAIDAARAIGAEPVPLLYAITQPSGTLSADAGSRLLDLFLQRLHSAQSSAPLDAILLTLHGAGVAATTPDIEGELVRAIREVVGPALPIAATFDLHGNVTQAMADELQGLFACRHYPHIDQHLRSGDAIALLQRCVRDGIRPRCDVVTLPMLLPTTTTFEGIGERMLGELLALQAEAGIIDLSWFHGFPYTDVPQVGCHICATSVDATGRQLAHRFAERLWAARASFLPTLLSGAEAVAAARAAHARVGGPVVINETSDNCGGGAPGDGTHLLRAMLDAGLGADACFAFVVDPVTAAQAHAAGVGARIDVELGGRTDDLHGKPIRTEAYVKALHDGRIFMTHMMRGTPMRLGPMARLVIEDLDVVVASERSQTFDRQPFVAVGIEPESRKIIALKSSNHFRGCYQALASEIITADTPGLTTHRVELFPRTAHERPLWPIDAAARFD